MHTYTHTPSCLLRSWITCDGWINQYTHTHIDSYMRAYYIQLLADALERECASAIEKLKSETERRRLAREQVRACMLILWYVYLRTYVYLSVCTYICIYWRVYTYANQSVCMYVCMYIESSKDGYAHAQLFEQCRYTIVCMRSCMYDSCACWSWIRGKNPNPAGSSLWRSWKSCKYIHTHTTYIHAWIHNVYTYMCTYRLNMSIRNEWNPWSSKSPKLRLRARHCIVSLQLHVCMYLCVFVCVYMHIHWFGYASCEFSVLLLFWIWISKFVIRAPGPTVTIRHAHCKYITFSKNLGGLPYERRTFLTRKKSLFVVYFKCKWFGVSRFTIKQSHSKHLECFAHMCAVSSWCKSKATTWRHVEDHHCNRA
jgi:hypothetical protein